MYQCRVVTGLMKYVVPTALSNLPELPRRAVRRDAVVFSGNCPHVAHSEPS